MSATISSLPRAAPADRAQESQLLEYVAVVDDDASVRRGFARLIGAYAFKVQTYESGEEFLASLKLCVPACLIVDLQMDDMTGLELLHHLTDMGLSIPAIIVTAGDETGIEAPCKTRGGVPRLAKAVNGRPV